MMTFLEKLFHFHEFKTNTDKTSEHYGLAECECGYMPWCSSHRNGMYLKGYDEILTCRGCQVETMRYNKLKK